MIKIIEYREVFKSKVKELIDDNFGEGYSNIKKLAGPEIKSFVAILGDELIGYSSVIINENEAVLDLIVVDKEHRGIGLGERLFKKRLNAINKAEEEGYDTAILDDGLQDKSIYYDITFVCFNNVNWIGNGMTIPSGPLRENINN